MFVELKKYKHILSLLLFIFNLLSGTGEAVDHCRVTSDTDDYRHIHNYHRILTESPTQYILFWRFF